MILRAERPDGSIGYGELAPIPEFGTETVERATAFLDSLVQSSGMAQDSEALADLPTCAFAVSCALADRVGAERDYSVCGLLPAGGGAVPALVNKVKRGYTVFKWKIGVADSTEEQAIFSHLVAKLPDSGRIRLDGNCGLRPEALLSWLRFLEAFRGQVDFLEQPLPVGEEAAMAEFSEASGFSIGLDESLQGADGARWLMPGAWDGPLVIKPALAGGRRELIDRLISVAGQVVLSSVFETGIGGQAALGIADELPGLELSIGWDTVSAFDDELAGFLPGPVIRAADRHKLSLEALWNLLPHSS